MSSFTGPLIVKKVGDRLWELHTDFEYHVGSEDSLDFITVPAGFQTDFASVPRIFWSLFPPDGRYTGAAVVHDWICKTDNIRTWKEKADIFIEAMEVLKVPWIKRQTMYWAVRAWEPFARK